IVRGNGLASGDSLSNLHPDVLNVNHQVTVRPQNLAHEMNEAGISLYIDVRKAARHLFKLASAKSFGDGQTESLPNFLLGIPRWIDCRIGPNFLLDSGGFFCRRHATPD